MTYRELLTILNQLDNEQLEMDVTVCENTPFDECGQIRCLGIVIDTDILDDGHPIIIIDG